MGRRAVLSPEQIASIYGDIMRFLGKPDTQKRETGGFILGYERTPDISELTQSAVAGAYKTYLAEKQESDAVDSADVRRLLSELLPLPRV